MFHGRSCSAVLALFSTLILGFIALPYTLAQRGAMTAPQSIDQLSREATLIVHGYVTSAKVEPHPQFHNLTTVLVTMTVQETLKGSAQKSIQFRQYVWDMRDRLDAAQYGKNEELLLLLGPVSPYGLRSPAGLEQGRFRISRTTNGDVSAVNGRGNLNLFTGTEQRARTRGIKLSARTTALVRRSGTGPVPLADLEDAIRTFAGSN